MPKYKTGFVWGQSISHNHYSSKVGFCFNTSDGKADKLEVCFYNENGKVKTLNKKLKPDESFIVDTNKIFGNSKI